jgi:hypothetical protein
MMKETNEEKKNNPTYQMKNTGNQHVVGNAPFFFPQRSFGGEGDTRRGKREMGGHPSRVGIVFAAAGRMRVNPPSSPVAACSKKANPLPERAWD